MNARSVTCLTVGAPLLTAALALAATGLCAAGERAVVSPVEATDVDVTLDAHPARLRGEARLRLKKPALPGEELALLLNRELTVLAVTDAAGRPLDCERKDASLTVRPPAKIKGKGIEVIRVRYQGSFSERVPEIGFYRAWVGPDFSYGLNAGQWYPQWSGADRRSRGHLSFTVPGDWRVSASGKLKAETKLGSRRRYDFDASLPVGFTFAAGPFHVLRKEVGGVDVGVFLLAGSPQEAERHLVACSEIVRFLTGEYGLFPYESYSVVEIPPRLLGNAGGGSYEGFTFYLPGTLTSPHTLAHELGHLWWGNLVRTPDGPVISEGLAQLSAARYLEHKFGEPALRRILKDGAPELALVHSARLYFRAIQAPAATSGPLSLLLRGEDLELGNPATGKQNTLHMLANSKGCFVYVMLRDLIGPEAFRAGLRGAVEHFAWQSMTVADLRAEFERTAGRDLRWFFDQWFFRRGAPEFVLSTQTVARGEQWEVKGSIRQVGDVYRVSAEILFVKGASREVRRIDIADQDTDFSVVLPFRPDTILFDPEYKILRWADEFKTE